MTKCVVIPHNKDYPLTVTELVSVNDFETVIGGRVENIYLRSSSILMYTNGNGKARRLPINKRATALWWLLQPELNGTDPIVGDVVVVGTLGRNFATDIPSSFIDLVLKPRQFRVLIAVTQQATGWLETPDKFDDYFEAALCAIGLMQMLEKPVRVRPV